MPDAFFASTKNRKRKRSTTSRDAGPSTSKTKRMAGGRKQDSGSQPGKAKAKARKRTADEELSDETQDDDNDREGIDDMDLRAPDVDPDAYESAEEDEDETPAQKRLRLAKMYLDSVKQGLSLAEGEFDAAEIDRELISARLRQDVMEHAGKVHLFVADKYDLEHAPSIRTKRSHRFSLTAAAASPDARWLYTAGKEGSIVKWDLHTGRQVHIFHKSRPDKGKGKGRGKGTGSTDELHGHTDEVWALAVSPDGKYLASGGKDRRVGVWDVEKNEWVKGFGGHRDCISALAFRKAQPSLQTPTQLYSGSYDRTLKLFDLSTMGYIETLFGHQAPVLSVDALRGETAVSAGGRDKTVRYWKVPEETQLVFRGGGGSKWQDDLEDMDEDEEGAAGAGRKAEAKSEKFIEGSIECVAMIDETTFVSGGDSGSISLWSTQRKKPVFTQALAHGMDLSQVEAEKIETVRKPRWITSLGSLRYSDLFASGSWDGEIRLWKLDAKLKSFALVGTFSALGVVNSLQFVSPPTGFFTDAAWTSRGESEEEGRPAVTKGSVAPALLVAGVGQELRTGRWVHQKGEGYLNSAVVFALHPRT
ncbi:WD40 repeat-like protein [Lentinus tigrinus ALCF2SS1-7]|uniref:WD40 repeat-like protein n=1 Tax=Lentinus tigrinus ALCF2SS1-6 TaxID=1328759 RepID=A0A5C2S472_9APHY|nr:WD40 repeat-like protein [Lentinus tigrinus ALCF2SS1-6]RPD72853.1 WD40 repeat-like protein [Lentinus tigrinus ALCF2SS1-7]